MWFCKRDYLRPPPITQYLMITYTFERDFSGLNGVGFEISLND